MNKLVIFDLDGVLIDSRELHYDALNDALRKINEQYVISREEHLSKYDGLNTTKKLEMLSTDKGLAREHYNAIWRAKQDATFKLIPNAPKNQHAFNIIKQLKAKGWKIAVASNSIRETVRISLESMSILGMVDYYVSNEDVFQAKPFPEMYWKCMVALNALPKDTIIVEDSHIGREGATNSGANLYPVKDAYDLNPSFIDYCNEFADGALKKNIPWRNKKMNVLIPMAGAGSRFAQAGYTFPKPLIEVDGKPMIQVVTENLNVDAHFIYIVQKEHYEKYNLKQLLNLIAPGCDIIQVDGLTEGAACTTLLAKELINNDEPLLMANSDQFVEWNSNECLYAFTADTIDGGIVTFESTHPKWSFAKLNSDGFVSEVAEKNPISNVATVGIYYWKHGSDYVKYAEQMINKNIRVNNEFYVCPVFNEAIADGKKIRTKNIEKMWGIGTPEDLNYFLEHHK
jgi:beta-phosphoglucomutase-like phosphatase (HAD superfamily)/dTDP-glucose pyrophosphorylase